MAALGTFLVLQFDGMAIWMCCFDFFVGFHAGFFTYYLQLVRLVQFENIVAAFLYNSLFATDKCGLHYRLT